MSSTRAEGRQVEGRGDEKGAHGRGDEMGEFYSLGTPRELLEGRNTGDDKERAVGISDVGGFSGLTGATKKSGPTGSGSVIRTFASLRLEEQQTNERARVGNIRAHGAMSCSGRRRGGERRKSDLNRVVVRMVTAWTDLRNLDRIVQRFR